MVQNLRFIRYKNIIVDMQSMVSVTLCPFLNFASLYVMHISGILNYICFFPKPLGLVPQEFLIYVFLLTYPHKQCIAHYASHISSTCSVSFVIWLVEDLIAIIWIP